MEGPQCRIFRDAAVGVVGSRIVADADQLDALQAKNTPGLRPAAIIADHHAHDRVTPIRSDAKSRKSEVAIREIALFQLLEARSGARFDRPRQMHLAIAAENLAATIDQYRAVVAPAIRRLLGVTDVESDAKGASAIEQALHGRIGHAALEILIERIAFEMPSREEGREGQLGKHNQAGAARGSRFQQLQHPAKRMFSRICFLRRPHLGSSGAEQAYQDCLQSVRIAYARGGRPNPGSAPTCCLLSENGPPIAITRAMIFRA